MEVEVLVANPNLSGAESTGTVQVNGTTVHRVGRRPGAPFYWSVLWGVPCAARRRMAQLPCDVIHVQGLERLGAPARRPCVVTIHGLNELDTRFRGGGVLGRIRSGGLAFLLKRARRRVRNVIAINPYVRNFLSPDVSQRVWEIPNPVADSYFEIERCPEPGRVLAAGAMIPRKNVAGLIEAFAQVAALGKPAELRLAGGGQQSAYGEICRRRAAELGLTAQVTFLGALDIASMQAELARAQCVALTSYHETAPLVISEAMAAGVPVVASRVCGTPWMVEDGRTGRLVDPHDASSIARGLAQVLYQDDAAALGAAGKQRAEQCFRPAVVVGQTLEVYRQVCRFPDP